MPPASTSMTFVLRMASSSRVFLGTLVRPEAEVERVEQLAVLVLGADDLDVVVELSAQQLQGVLVHRLGGRDHFAQVEEHLDERGRIRVDLLREVGQGRTARQPQHLAVAARDLHAADTRRRHVVELLAALLLALAASGGTATLPAEGAGRTGPTPATAAAGTPATTGTTAQPAAGRAARATAAVAAAAAGTPGARRPGAAATARAAAGAATIRTIGPSAAGPSAAGPPGSGTRR